VLAGNLLLEEKVTPLLTVALALVGLGIYLVNRAPRLGAAAPKARPADAELL
jgi:drug/metabolite transporter (DMT)-like permease